MFSEATLSAPNGISVLVADDDADIVELLAEVLTAEGYSVSCASRGEEAWHGIRQLRPDVALVDVWMPEVAGTEVLARVRAAEIDTAVILMSAQPDLATAAEALKYRASIYLQKPFDVDEVVRAVASAAEVNRLEREKRLMLERLRVQEEQLRVAAADAEARAADLDAVHAVANAGTQSLHSHEVLQATLRAVCQVLHARAEILLLDGPGQHLVPAAYEGPVDGAPPQSPIAISDGIPGEVATSRQPIFVTELATDPRWLRRLSPGAGWTAVGCVPLPGRGRPLGVLVAGRGRPFDAREQALLPKLAEVAGVSIENSLLFERAQTAVTSLQQSQQRMIENERLAVVGQLTAGLAHEINTPCSFLLANLHVLRGHLAGIERLTTHSLESAGLPSAISAAGMPALLAEMTQIVDDCVIGGERIRRIVRDLRTFGRGAREARQSTDLNELLDSTLSMMQAELTMRARVERHLDPVASVEAHPGRIAQVFVHLLMNAMDATPAGDHSRGIIEVSSSMDDDRWVVVRIKDSGVGIPAEVLPRIFEPYFTTKPVGEGTGLGLAVSLDIVRHHGGDLRIYSSLGRGTIAEVRLPVPMAKASTAPEPSPQPRRRILVVDDEPNVLRAVARQIGQDHDVVTAQNGAAALAILEQDQRFDGILCDLVMPGVTGIDVYDAIRARHPALVSKFTVLTGGTFNERAHRFLHEQHLRILEKPFDLEELRRFLDTL